MHPNEHKTPHSIRPQNPSCPAGGTSHARSGQRGVIVAPPFRNTHDPALFPILHQGFDTLTLSIKATMTPQMFDAFEAERARAEAVAEKSRLQQVAEAQSHALLGAARQMQAMRSTYEQQKQELAREAQKSRQLERGLRALTRNQCNV